MTCQIMRATTPGHTKECKNDAVVKVIDKDYGGLTLESSLVVIALNACMSCARLFPESKYKFEALDTQTA